MTGFAFRTLIAALGLWVAAAIVPNMEFSGVGTLLIAAILLGLVNATVRPLCVLLTLPLTILTLGLFLLVVNAAMLALVAALLEGFDLGGFFSALLGAVVVSVTGWIGSRYIGPEGRVEILTMRGRAGTPEP